MALNTPQGIAASLIGLGIIAGAHRLALLPKRWRGFYTRDPSLKQPKAVYSETGVRALTLFWRFCGALWLAAEWRCSVIRAGQFTSHGYGNRVSSLTPFAKLNQSAYPISHFHPHAALRLNLRAII
jgi:hypothetical protein